MAFRPSFECLWCGRAWEARSDDDLEGWAALCPDCLGKADDNGFLRSRLRTALRDRATAASAAAPLPEPSAGDWEDWYLRRGRYSRGPIHDGPWSMQLEEVTRWLDGLTIGGVIVELGAGMGWWSGLLAEKGELWVYDTDGASLEAARKRLVAHGLLAHLHQRDLLASPDKTVDVVFAAYLLGRPAPATLEARLAAIRAWLKPGGSLVLVEAGTAGGAGVIDGPAGPMQPPAAEALRPMARRAGFESVEVSTTRNAFMMGRAQVST